MHRILAIADFARTDAGSCRIFNQRGEAILMVGRSAPVRHQVLSPAADR
jgi:hypothetical protein